MVVLVIVSFCIIAFRKIYSTSERKMYLALGSFFKFRFRPAND